MSLDNLFRVLGPLISLIVGIIWVKTELAKYGERIKSHDSRIGHLENGKFEEVVATLETNMTNLTSTISEFKSDVKEIRKEIQELNIKLAKK